MLNGLCRKSQNRILFPQQWEQKKDILFLLPQDADLPSLSLRIIHYFTNFVNSIPRIYTAKRTVSPIFITSYKSICFNLVKLAIHCFSSRYSSA